MLLRVVVRGDLHPEANSPLQHVTERRNVFKLYLAPIINYVIIGLDELVFNLLKIRTMAESNRADPQSQPVLLNSLEKITNGTHIIQSLINSSTIDYLPRALNVGHSEESAAANYKDLNAYCQGLFSNITQLTSQISSSIINGFRFSDLQSKIHSILVTIAKVQHSDCLIQYGRLLDDIEATYQYYVRIIATAYQNAHLQMNTAELLNQETKYLNDLETVYSRYNVGELSKVELNAEVDHLIRTKQWNDNAFEELYSYINDMHIQAGEFLQQTQVDVEHLYMETLKHTQVMQLYFPSHDMTARAKNLSIWRGPEVPITGPTVSLFII